MKLWGGSRGRWGVWRVVFGLEVGSGRGCWVLGRRRVARGSYRMGMVLKVGWLEVRMALGVVLGLRGYR